MPAYYRNQWGQVVPLPESQPEPPPESQPEPLSAPAASPLPEPQQNFTIADATDSPEVAEALLAAIDEVQAAEAAPDETTESPRRRPRRHTRRRRRRPPVPEPREGSKSHHQRHCVICDHPDRRPIEEEFLHWHNPGDIARAYEIGWRSVYRHAHAMGLFARRDANLRFALGGIIQRCDNVEPDANAVIRAVRAYTHVTSAGEWVDPPHRVVVSYENHAQEPARVSELPDARQSPASFAAAALGDPGLGHTTIDLQPTVDHPFDAGLPDNENKVETRASS